MRLGRLTTLLLAVFAMPLPALAQTSSWLYEIRGGVLAHDVPIVAAGHYENGVSLNAELAFTPSLQLFGGSIRPVLGGTYTTNQGTSWVYLDARWEWTVDRFFFGFGVGPSIHTGDELYYSGPGYKGLGSRVLFHIPLEVGFQLTPQTRLEFYYEHASNGFTVYPNPGMDNLGGRLAFKF